MKKGFWNAQKPMEMSFKQLFKPMIGFYSFMTKYLLTLQNVCTSLI